MKCLACIVQVNANMTPIELLCCYLLNECILQPAAKVMVCVFYSLFLLLQSLQKSLNAGFKPSSGAFVSEQSLLYGFTIWLKKIAVILRLLMTVMSFKMSGKGNFCLPILSLF